MVKMGKTELLREAVVRLCGSSSAVRVFASGSSRAFRAANMSVRQCGARTRAGENLSRIRWSLGRQGKLFGKTIPGQDETRRVGDHGRQKRRRYRFIGACCSEAHRSSTTPNNTKKRCRRPPHQEEDRCQKIMTFSSVKKRSTRRVHRRCALTLEWPDRGTEQRLRWSMR